MSLAVVGKLYRQVALVSMAGFSLAGGATCAYSMYDGSKNKDFVTNVGETAVGFVFGTCMGAGLGAIWPITSSVAVARYYQRWKAFENEKI